LEEPPSALNAALLGILEDLVATDFPARAQRQAELIARRLPDLVGLQEVWDVSCVDASPSTVKAARIPRAPPPSSIIWKSPSTRLTPWGSTTNRSRS
jgi:hypothetical protein